MKINVHAGHTSQKGKAPGASGIVHESVENRKIVKELIAILKEKGATVYNCTSDGKNSSDNLYLIIKKSNAHVVDLDVSIHLNDYNGKAHGTETLIYSEKSKAKPYAERIDKNLSKLGFTDRGVKVRNDLYVLRKSNAPALLVECFFDDSKKDVDIYKKVGAKGIAKAIADGILSVAEKPTPKPTTKPTPKPTTKLSAPTITLVKGNKGEQVKMLQMCLNKLVDAKLDVNGSYDPATEKAVKAYQKKKKLTVDGMCGPVTRSHIKADLK